MLQGHRDWKCLQASVWQLRHWRTTVEWSIRADLLKIKFFSYGGAQKPHKHGIGNKTKREESSFFPVMKYFFVSLFAVAHAAEYAPISWHKAQGAFILKGATAERFIMVMCLLGRSSCRGLWDEKTRERNKEPNLIESIASWKPWHTDVWTDDEERERSLSNKDASGVQQRRE